MNDPTRRCTLLGAATGAATALSVPSAASGGTARDTADPTTGSVGHRILVLDQSMIMAAPDNALRGRARQRHFAADRVSAVAPTYLGPSTATCADARAGGLRHAPPPSTTRTWTVSRTPCPA